MKYTNLIRTGGNIADTMKKQRNQLKTKTEEQADSLMLAYSSVIKWSVNVVRKWKPISYFTLTFTITFFSSTSVTPGA